MFRAGEPVGFWLITSGGEIPGASHYRGFDRAPALYCQQRLIRRAAFQKLPKLPILMITRWNFDCATGFCPRRLSARFQPAFNRSQFAYLVSGTPETTED
jgi:hypothetical protein